MTRLISFPDGIQYAYSVKKVGEHYRLRREVKTPAEPEWEPLDYTAYRTEQEAYDGMDKQSDLDCQMGGLKA